MRCNRLNFVNRQSVLSPLGKLGPHPRRLPKFICLLSFLEPTSAFKSVTCFETIDGLRLLRCRPDNDSLAATTPSYAPRRFPGNMQQHFEVNARIMHGVRGEKLLRRQRAVAVARRLAQQAPRAPQALFAFRSFALPCSRSTLHQRHRQIPTVTPCASAASSPAHSSGVGGMPRPLRQRRRAALLVPPAATRVEPDELDLEDVEFRDPPPLRYAEGGYTPFEYIEFSDIPLRHEAGAGLEGAGLAGAGWRGPHGLGEPSSSGLLHTYRWKVVRRRCLPPPLFDSRPRHR